MKLERFGIPGSERPVLIDAQGRLPFYSPVLTLAVITTTCPCMHPQCRTVGPDLRPRQAL